MVGAEQAGPLLDVFAAGELRGCFERLVLRCAGPYQQYPDSCAAGVEDVRRNLNAVEQSKAASPAALTHLRHYNTKNQFCTTCAPFHAVFAVASSQSCSVPAALLHFIDSGGSPLIFTLEEIERAQALLALRPFQPLQKFSDNLVDEQLKVSVSSALCMAASCGCMAKFLGEWSCV